MATNNSTTITTTNRYLTHTPPLFRKLNILTIYDIYNLQVGSLIYESQNNLGPINDLLNIPLASDIHHHNTRFALTGNLHIRSVRTTRYGLKSIQTEGAKFWLTIPSDIRNKPSKKSFKSNLKKYLISKYDNPA